MAHLDRFGDRDNAANRRCLSGLAQEMSWRMPMSATGYTLDEGGLTVDFQRRIPLGGRAEKNEGAQLRRLNGLCLHSADQGLLLSARTGKRT